jgi:radical SAM enzyme (TIGR01210 family)
MMKKSQAHIEKFTGELQNTALEGNLKKSHYYKFISEAQRIIHAQIPEEKYSANKVASTDFREEVFEGVNYKRVVVYLMSNGCEWALKNGNGCTMCGHLARQARRDKPFSVNDYLQQFEKEIKNIDFKRYPLLNLYNNGSFVNDNEIPSEARREILKKINSNPDIKMVVLETRPEFVTEETIKEIRSLIPNKHIEVAMGLEVKDDFYRTLCLNKGFSLRQFNVAAEIIKKYLSLRAYVFLKPMFLTEKESLEQAIETIEYVFSIGGTTSSLEACTVQDYTLIQYLHEQGLYTTPWLWSIIEVIKRVRVPGKLLVGMFQFYPSPFTVPHNCEKCNDRVMEAIRQYNRTLDRKVFAGLTCSCKEKWTEILKEKPLPFHKRLERMPELLKQLRRSSSSVTCGA